MPAAIAASCYSRAGYGRSTPRRAGERWPVDFMHAQARDVLPRLFERLGVGADGAKPWLFGHSDGASIALIHAASFPDAVAGVVAVAPHIFVEDAVDPQHRSGARRVPVDRHPRRGLRAITTTPIPRSGAGTTSGSIRQFRAWSIEAMLARACDAPYSRFRARTTSTERSRRSKAFARRAPQTEVVVLANCGHSPHRDQPEALTRAVIDFIARHSPAPTRQGEVQ